MATQNQNNQSQNSQSQSANNKTNAQNNNLNKKPSINGLTGLKTF